MKSLRLLLAGWMVPLLGVVLLAVGFLAYRTADRLLVERQGAARDLEALRRDERVKERLEQLDKELLDQAQNLARLMQFQLDWGKFRFRDLHILGMLGVAMADKGFVMIPGWTAPVGRGPVAMEFFRRAVPEIRFNDQELQHHLDDIAEYFQVDTTWGSVFRSASLGMEEMAINKQAFFPDQVLHHEFDSTSLANGVAVRRVRLKAPAGRVPFFALSRRGPGGFEGRPPGRPPAEPGRGEPPPPDRPRGEAAPRSLVFIQCAYPLSKLEPALELIRGEYETRVEELESASRRTRLALAWQLAGLGAATFALAIGGTVALVGWSLRPLQRLSEAVSRISERDFTLRVDPADFPSEVYPVCIRLRETLVQLERAFLREKHATADISHELRTPLASMLTTLDLALRRPRAAAEYKSFLEDCRMAAGHMRGIVERLITLARLDSGSDPVRPQPTNASELAEECAQIVRPVAKARDITLDVDAGAPCWLLADPDKLREVICNLLHNAVQYNKPAGSIRLRVAQGQDTVLIEVADTGIGIPANQLDLIFERFHRVDPSRHGDGSSAGLGLSIVKGYVTLMGGAIAVESEPGRGTTFRLHLPVKLGLENPGRALA
ncbi:MAG: sensor histidine kinase [Planctomycetota bacterium]